MPSPPPAGPSANDQLAIAIVAHLAAMMPRTSDEQQLAASRMLRARDLGGVSLRQAMAFVEAYASEEMFFSLATFRAAFETFSAPKRAVATTEEMFDTWRKKREEIEREREQVDAALAGLPAGELARIRDEIADEVAARGPDPAKKEPADEQRRDNRLEAVIIRKGDPTKPGVARAMVYARITREKEAAEGHDDRA